MKLDSFQFRYGQHYDTKPGMAKQKSFLVHKQASYKDKCRQTDRQTDRKAERQTDRQKGRQLSDALQNTGAPMM